MVVADIFNTVCPLQLLAFDIAPSVGHLSGFGQRCDHNFGAVFIAFSKRFDAYF